MLTINRHPWIAIVFVMCSVLFISCGPSPEEQAATAAAQTAEAATDTPVPTPTDTPTPTTTPVPYDLSVLVTGEEDLPIVGAYVVLAELEGEDGTQMTDDAGQAFWYDLPGESVSLSIGAQGYLPIKTIQTILHGENQIEINLERDPFGLLPSEACAPGERLLYFDDFQDGHAQGWQGIERRETGWNLEPLPDRPGDMVVSHSGREFAHTMYDPTLFENAVWRFQYMMTGLRTITLKWHMALEPYEIDEGWVDDSYYQADFAPRYFYALRVTNPIWVQELLYTDIWNPVGEWRTVEISTYEDVFQVWMDGRRYLKYTDPQPLPGGGLLIQTPQTADPDSFVYFNNMSVCELLEPFTPMPTPES